MTSSLFDTALYLLLYATIASSGFVVATVIVYIICPELRADIIADIKRGY